MGVFGYYQWGTSKGDLEEGPKRLPLDFGEDFRREGCLAILLGGLEPLSKDRGRKLGIEFDNPIY